MYAIGTRVFVKSLQAVGEISEANWSQGEKRHAEYLVSFYERIGLSKRSGKGRFMFDYLTSAKDLRRADMSCDACSRWLPWWSFNGGHAPCDTDGIPLVRLCYLCSHEADGY